jgi:hypothetical protein
VLGSGLFIAGSAVLIWRKHVSNPIGVGTGIWLCVGALAFNVPLAPLKAWLVAVQAFALFLGVVAVGLVATFASKHGYVGARSDDPNWLRKSSLVLLLLSFGALLWAWLFRDDVRVGGGLPFIVLNVARRVLIRRQQALPGP